LRVISAKAGRYGEMKLNNYHNDLEFAENSNNDALVRALIKKEFPNVVICEPNHKGKKSQRDGVDWFCYLDNNAVIRLDVKFRRQQWPDVLLEFKSSEEKNTPGWIEKENLYIDYVLYVFIPSQIGIFLPWQQLRRAWQHKKDYWLSTYGTVDAINQDNGIRYTTVSTPVPVEELLYYCALSYIIQIDKQLFKIKPIKRELLKTQLLLFKNDVIDKNNNDNNNAPTGLPF